MSCERCKALSGCFFESTETGEHKPIDYIGSLNKSLDHFKLLAKHEDDPEELSAYKLVIATLEAILEDNKEVLNNG